MFCSFVDLFLRKHLEERERAEMSHHTVEKKYTEVISQLSSIISVDEMSSATFTVEEIIRKVGFISKNIKELCPLLFFRFK